MPTVVSDHRLLLLVAQASSEAIIHLTVIAVSPPAASR
ncbi:hypothetical protein QFZ32_000744 [Streptomyces canus]|nr:hypothetical protein [Streptomyces canus]MDQ1065304.1 hypothetical protein [Streptomyces canus]